MKDSEKNRKQITSQSIYRDGWFLGLTVLTLATVAVCIIWGLTHIRQTQIQIPIRFSSLTNFDQLGAWYQLYEIPIIAAIIAAANFALANALHKRNRLVSIFLMMSALMAAILATVILVSFTVINYGPG